MTFRRFLATLTLGTVLVAPAAHADSPFTSNFWFSGVGANWDSFQGSFTSGSEGFFQIFCVNPDLDVSAAGNPHDVWVTPFNATGAETQALNPNGNVWLGNYVEAAQIATFMVGNWPAQTTWNANEVASIQHAIWYAMGFTNDNNGNPINSAHYTYWMTQWNDSGLSINIDNWFVITGRNASGDMQEFISFRDTPFETVPEPATMTLLATGLAGMAAARRRRKS